MPGMTTSNTEMLRRSEVWSGQLKDILEDELYAKAYVNWLSEFPDGDTFTVPSIGQAVVRNYSEDNPIQYDALDTGEFQFSISEYLSSATYITNKAKQDGFYMQQLIAEFVPSQARAINEHIERSILGLQSQQTSGSLNKINGADHRWVASGTNETIALSDFAKALYSLKKANVPDVNLIAIVDPSVEYAINTLSNIVNVSNNPRWEGVINDSMASGMRFLKNIYGFDVYTSNYLADANETISGKTTAAGKANLFFSAAPGVLPFIGAFRQMPVVESEYNKDMQREEYVTTARYGVKLYRPENLVVVLSDTDQV